MFIYLKGTAVTVEFSGLGGSKSLELYLPDKDTYLDGSVPVLVNHAAKTIA